MSDENKNRVQADNNSIAIGSISAGGNIGDVRIQIGYTSEQVAVLIAQIRSTFQVKPFDGRCPYKGLDVFEEDDAELFFGREKLVNDLVSRVKDSRTVFVTGPSGSGKSSLVRAGLIHALKQGAIKGSDRWLYATMKPGRDPIGELGRVVSSLASSTNPEDEIRAKAMKDATIFARWCEIALKEGRDKRLVLFIDQFEEVFTQISNEAERVAFLNLLTHAVTIEGGRVIILFSMRSDFVSNCATYPQLNALLNQQFVQIGAMQPEELVSAIAQPALRVGLRIDPDLIAQIINEMKGEPGALPLMQFALKDLFDSQQEKSGVPALILNDYLQRGGIHKALERHADDSFSKLSKNEQELARSIFSGLIEIGRGTQDTKRTALFDELVPANTNVEDVETIVQKLADARLITTDEQAGKETVTISHEKLIDAWPWLKRLVNENRDVIALQNEIASDAKEWDEHSKDVSYLYTGGRLANVREQLEKQKIALGQLGQEFVRVGRARQRRAQVFLISAVSVFLIVSIVASVVFQNQAQQNIKIANTAQAAQATSQANAEEARNQANIALARQISAQAQPLFVNGNSKEETAVLLAIQSMRLYPAGDAAQVLQNNTLAKLISRIMYSDSVNSTALNNSIAFNANGKYVVLGGCDQQESNYGCTQGSARVWEVSTGKEISRMTYDSYVTSVAFSPDGKYVVSGGCDQQSYSQIFCTQGSIRMWEASTGKEISRMTTYEGEVGSVAFSADSMYVVSGSYDNTARVWEASTGKEISRMTYDSYVSSVAFSPNGKYVVSGGCDQLDSVQGCAQGSIRVWGAATGKEVARMTHDGFVSSAAFSPDGKYVVSGSSDYTARMWEANTGKEIARMTHDGLVYSVAFSPDGNYIVSGSWDETARVWEASTGKEISRITHDRPVNSVAFSPNGKLVISGSDDKTARVWEASTGKEIARMTHDRPVNSVAFSPDGKVVISGSDNNTARVWEISTRKEVARMIHDDYVNSVVFSPDGKYVVSGSGDNTARVWEVDTGKEVARVTHDGAVSSVAFSPNSKYVVSGSTDNTARVWEVDTGKEVARMTHDGTVSSVAFSPDSKYVVSGSTDNTARVWEAATGKEIARMNHNNWVSTVAFSPDGKYVVSGGVESRRGSLNNNSYSDESATTEEIAYKATNNIWFTSLIFFRLDSLYFISKNYLDNGVLENPTIRIWEASTGKEIARMTHDNNEDVYLVAFSPDGKYVISGSGDKTARVWEAATGKEVARMTHDGFVSSVAFTPDSKYVVSGSSDNTARVWEVDTGKEVARMTHDGVVRAVAFSPEGKYVVSGGDDGTTRVWGITTGVEVARMTHDDGVTSATFSTGGKYIVSGSHDNTARVWIYRPEDLIVEACSHVTRNLTRAEWDQYIGDVLPYQAVCPNLPIEAESMPVP